MTTSSAPLVSVVLAARDAERFVGQAVESILRQSLRDLELVVIDDGSRDSTSELLAAVADPRLVVVRNEEPAGLAAALNRGFAEARGTYVARMDADDVALQDRLALQLASLRSASRPAVVGGGVAEIDEAGRIGAVHVFPAGLLVTRWLSLFGTPFFHPTVVVERAALQRHDLRYDSDYDAGDASTEDYDLWSRLLEVASGDNVSTPVLLYRRHQGQASERRAEHQLVLRRRIALRGIAAVAPLLGPEGGELAWLVGDARDIPSGRATDAVEAHLSLLHAFVGASERGSGAELQPVRQRAARAVARVALRANGSERSRLLRRAFSLDPLLAVHVVGGRLHRRRLAQTTRDEAVPWLAALDPTGPTDEAPRVVIVSPEPTPFRSLMFDWMAKRPELDLTVVYAGRTIAGRTWTIAHDHHAVFLGGLRVPGASKLLLHDYPVTLGIFGALTEARPDVVVVSGWSTFACQAAMLWCRTKRVPYLLLVESHDIGPRSGWRRAVKGAVVPRAVRGAARILVIGRLARESVLARGGRPERISWFANTIDVADWGNRAERLAGNRSTLRAVLGAGDDDIVMLSVARLVPEKGLDTLVRAVAEARDPRLIVVVFGQGPDGPALEQLARELGIRLRLVDDLPWERVVEAYVAADIFALLSTHEPWGVVVNEAAACGLPLILSDRVGAAYDLLRDGENGALVPAGDVEAAARAIQGLAADKALRLAQGARSRELMSDWGYEPSVESFVAAVREAIASK